VTLTVGKLIRVLQGLPNNYTLEKNAVGNLVVVDDQGNVIGWVDLQAGAVEMFVY
jgi:hypothetical protein